MSGAVFLDASPLGLVIQKQGRSPEVKDCQKWLQRLIAHHWEIYVPEVTDYEVRRGLIHENQHASVVRLDELGARFNYVPITTDAMRMACYLWATARRGGYATAHPERLDADVILAAQAMTLTPQPSGLVIATENVAHLSRYCAAQEWSTIMP